MLQTDCKFTLSFSHVLTKFRGVGAPEGQVTLGELRQRGGGLSGGLGVAGPESDGRKVRKKVE